MKGQAKAFVSKTRVRRYLDQMLDHPRKKRVPQKFWIALDAVVIAETKRLIGPVQSSLL